MSKLRISVAVCTYNGEQFLEEQLVSIQNQTLIPDELVVFDDRSTDTTVKLLEKFAEQSTRIQVKLNVNKSNIGYVKNFEQAIAACTGDIIFLADQDDIWQGDKIETVCGLFNENPMIMGITHDGRLVDEIGHWHGTFKGQQILRAYGLNNRTITGALSSFRSDIIPWLIPFPEGIHGHDAWMTYLFSWCPERWLFSDQSLGDVRRHSSNTSQWVVNSFTPVGRLDVLRAQINTPVAHNYFDRLSMNACLAGLIAKQRLPTIDLFAGLDEQVLAQLEAEYRAIRLRQSIAAGPKKAKRWLKACRFLATGGYGYFNGAKSFFRDLIR